MSKDLTTEIEQLLDKYHTDCDYKYSSGELACSCGVAKSAQSITSILDRAIMDAQIEELGWAKSQVSGLAKSHVGRSFYNRNTAFKNYAVKFWNNRTQTIRSKFDDRIKELRTHNKENKYDKMD